ncbi:MAG: hypothetical protein WCK17_13835 [Verrucomicrobiota bacterium]
MQTVFSHIVQKRLSQESENVATVALEFILNSSEAARNGMMKLLRGVIPQLPRLWFRTQQTEDNNRPDMWGYDDGAKPHVLVENKFWAGLTDKQPVSYLTTLAKHAHPTMLLVVVPEAREEMVWRELKRRVEEAGKSAPKKKAILATEKDGSVGNVRCIATGIGPILALTSWTRLLAFLELEVVDDKSAKSDLLQLRALCDAVESDAFVPFSAENISDQRSPALILQLVAIVQASLQKAFAEDVLNSKGIGNQWRAAPHIGRYASVGNKGNVGFWFGIHFELWKQHGGSPLWVSFSPSSWGRAPEVRALLEPWAAKNRVFTASQGTHFVVAIDVTVGEEKDTVVKAVVDRLREIADVLSALKPKTHGKAEEIAETE